MSYHFEKLLDYLRAGEFEEADKYFDWCKKEGLLSQEQIAEWNKRFRDTYDRFEKILEKNPNVFEGGRA